MSVKVARLPVGLAEDVAKGALVVKADDTVEHRLLSKGGVSEET